MWTLENMSNELTNLQVPYEAANLLINKGTKVTVKKAVHTPMVIPYALALALDKDKR
jgi:hypothetical protein